MNLNPSKQYTAYLSFEGFENELAHELGHFIFQGERLFVAEGPERSVIWAQDTWRDIQILSIDSIGDAAKKLKNEGAYWAHYSSNWHRRSTLISEQLLQAKRKPLKFLEAFQLQKFGSWSLISPNEIIFSLNNKSPFPLGEVKFIEDKEIPPSRAYLKLWELFTVHAIKPRANSMVIDVGSSPGGWTWVLQQMGCQVTSVDKARLDAKIASLPRIEFLKKDAFQLKPQDVGEMDWLFSDIICYPAKLWDYLQPWIATPTQLVCTIKFQGETDWETLKKFQSVPNSKILHLFHNKHEVTWLRTHDKN